MRQRSRLRIALSWLVVRCVASTPNVLKRLSVNGHAISNIPEAVVLLDGKLVTRRIERLDRDVKAIVLPLSVGQTDVSSEQPADH
jgi:hypothetical protein